MRRETVTGLLMAILLGATTRIALADPASHRQEVDNLFRLTNMEKMIDDSVDNVFQLQLRQDPRLQQHADALHAFITRQIGWQAMKNDIADMYIQHFSEQELKDINTFYITPVGQKIINDVPTLVQRRNQLAMKRLQENIGELQKIIGTTSEQP